MSGPHIFKGKVTYLPCGPHCVNKDITEQFLFCKALPEITEGQDIFDVADSHFSSYDLTWKSCIGMCTDGTHSMSGSLKGFVTTAKEKNPRIVFTHSFLHREALIPKSVAPEIKKALNVLIKS
jgi:hypothetical protein